jgi:polyvinyl alcohol dehydrogenase (cytochrome)
MSVLSMHPTWLFQTPQPVTASPTVSGGQVYVGDAGGTFYDINAATGAQPPVWSFSIGKFSCPGDPASTDQHTPSYGGITSSAAVGAVPGLSDSVVYFGGGGTLFALDAKNGTCLWAQDLDPQNPTSAMEVESSPVLLKNGDNLATEVLVGSDVNESPGSGAPPGLQAFDAKSGRLLWKFEPENNTTVGTLLSAPDTDGCGDVWSSPALDQKATGTGEGDGLVVLTTGNCPQLATEQPGAASDPLSCPGAPTPTPPELEGIAALDPTTGCLVWRWTEPPSTYTGTSYPDGGDTDIGSSPILGAINGPNGAQPVVLDGSKSGYMYAIAEATGATVWAAQPAQPGETGPAFAGAIGGFIGSSALDNVKGRPTVFGTTAIPMPFDGNGAPSPDTTLVCVDVSSGTPAPAQHCDPLRLASLHAVDADTGNTLWQGVVSLPSYAATTTTNGVVFAPSTTGFAIAAYSARTGTPLWAFPTGGAMSSGAAIVGPSVFVGAGTAEQFGPSGTPTIPPDQVNGVWCFSVA